jgi:hypothetical protein
LEFAGYVVSDSVEPLSQEIPPADDCSFAGQNQESSLKGIIGIGRVTENTSADTQHHWPMSLNERSKRILIALAHEQIQKLTIGSIVPGKLIDVIRDENLNDGVDHLVLVSVLPCPTNYSPPTSSLIHLAGAFCHRIE